MPRDDEVSITVGRSTRDALRDVKEEMGWTWDEALRAAADALTAEHEPDEEVVHLSPEAVNDVGAEVEARLDRVLRDIGAAHP